MFNTLSTDRGIRLIYTFRLNVVPEFLNTKLFRQEIIWFNLNLYPFITLTMLTTVAGNVIWELASSRLQGFQMNIPRNETIRLNRTLYKHHCFQSERLEFSDLTTSCEWKVFSISSLLLVYLPCTELRQFGRRKGNGWLSQLLSHSLSVHSYK